MACAPKPNGAASGRVADLDGHSVRIAPATADSFPITRVSRDFNGGEPNAHSEVASISTSRYVAFSSFATDLVPGGESSGISDVFVRDMAAGTTTKISVDPAGGEAFGHSHGPSITADGRYVAFFSDAWNLVPGDVNNSQDVFVRDLIAGTTIRISVDTAGGDANGHSYTPSISANGRYVAFESVASDLVAGDGTGGFGDVFVHDLVMRTTTRVSVDTTGGDPNDWSESPTISGHGRYVAFHSYAPDLMPGDGNNERDVFVRDLATTSTTRVSVDTAGGDANGSSEQASISPNGRYVAFDSSAPDLVTEDGNGSRDVFVRDLAAGTTTRVSVDTAGGDANNGSLDPSISGDGRYVAYESMASDLVTSDSNFVSDVFVHDLLAGVTTRISTDRTGGDPNGASRLVSISYGGTFVAFQSAASNLVGGDGFVPDIFRRRLR